MEIPSRQVERDFEKKHINFHAHYTVYLTVLFLKGEPESSGETQLGRKGPTEPGDLEDAASLRK
jgi:hypothetical protein